MHSLFLFLTLVLPTLKRVRNHVKYIIPEGSSERLSNDKVNPTFNNGMNEIEDDQVGSLIHHSTVFPFIT